jgi:hypothetical protein
MKLSRERKEETGAFYTPKIWADLAVKYILSLLTYPEHYTYYDPAAGEGALLDALPSHFNKIASTLEEEDVEILKAKGYKNAFQFDFLDGFIGELDLNTESPMLEVLKARDKLIIFTNPPFTTLSAKNNCLAKKMYDNHNANATVLFFLRIKYEIQPFMLFSFNKADIWTSPNLSKFRGNFDLATAIGINADFRSQSIFSAGFDIFKTKKNSERDFVQYFGEYLKTTYNLEKKEYNLQKIHAPQEYQPDGKSGLFMCCSNSWEGLNGVWPIVFNGFRIGKNAGDYPRESEQKAAQNPQLLELFAPIEPEHEPINYSEYANLQEFINSESDDIFNNQLITLVLMEIKHKSGNINENIVLLCSNRHRVVYGGNAIKERYYKHYSNLKQELPVAALNELNLLIFEGSKMDFPNAHKCKHWLFCQTGINWITLAIAEVNW